MDKAFLLEQIKLLAALEAWALSSEQLVPDYLFEKMDKVADRLSAELLRESSEIEVERPWINWHGGENPVTPESTVTILMRDLTVMHNGVAGVYRWRHEGEDDDIIAYRVEE